MGRNGDKADGRYAPFVKEIEAAAAGGHRAGDALFDAARMMALAIQKPLALSGGDEIEAEWQRIRDRYSDGEYAHIATAFGLLMDALEEKREEFLGHVMERCFGATNQHAGQFLTPVSVAGMMGRIVSEEPRDEIVTLHDPCCGCGVLVIEGAEKLLERGWEQRNILIDVGDIDIHALDMCYVQLSLLGFAAVVHHRDALRMKALSPDRFTPGYYIHAIPMRRARGAAA